MTAALDVLLPSDVFPPRCGGAGWSAHTLALALIERGHRVRAIVPCQGAPTRAEETVLGVPTLRLGYAAPRIPIVQNYFRHERLWGPLAAAIEREALRFQALSEREASRLPCSRARLVIHAQHVQSASAAILAGRRLRAPVVITVRDHWPWDYFSTGLHADRLPYGRQTPASLATDLVARLGPLRGALALPAIPYLLAHVRRRQRALQAAGAVIAVSDYMARRLAGIVAPERIHVIPNMVDLAAIDAAIATAQASVPSGQPYLLFVGKLERNKGAHLLIDIFRELVTSLKSQVAGRRSQVAEDGGFSIFNFQFSIPELVIAGDGPLRPELERELAALGVRARFLDWIGHEEVLRLMAGCAALLFPSAWGEPLSRVPLEAAACGAAIVAMPTGGTPSIIADGVNGALEPTVAGFARRLAALLAQPGQRRTLGAAARCVVQERFSKAAVVGRVENLYRTLVGE